MTVRTARERLLQSAGYEIGSLLVATPVCAALTGKSPEASAVLVAVLTVATMVWSPLFNTLFDRVEWHLSRRVASDRSRRLRLVHAFALEASDAVISVPILMILGGLDLWQALVADVALLAVCTVYTYAYHQVFDWLRPLRN
jgi:uncharacterized membrane protein